MKAVEARTIYNHMLEYKNEQRAKGLIEVKFASCIKAVTNSANDAKSYCEVAV